MAHTAISQSELARRIGVTQGAIAKIVSNNPGGSSKLHLIARELLTTPAYLTGETDDPDEGAPPPPSEPRAQHVSLPVALPTTRALAAAFRGVLQASRDMDEAELAHELAELLPSVLRIAGDALPAPDQDLEVLRPELDRTAAGAAPARRRA